MERPDFYTACARGGFPNPRTTPVDTLMNAPYGMHLSVADAMEFPDKDDIEHQDTAEA